MEIVRLGKSGKKKPKNTYKVMTPEQKIEILAHNFKVLFDKVCKLENRIK